MQFETFQQSIIDAVPPAGTGIYLAAMWYDRKGDWEKAHSILNDLEDLTACWVHAYLHRKEGDSWNADYSYRKAAKKSPSVSYQREWEAIVKALL